MNLVELAGTDDRLILLLRGGGVRRYHAEGRAFDQTVAEHCWRAAVILLYMWPGASLELLRAVLHHDTAEGIIGDIPSPTKRELSGIGEIEATIEQQLGIEERLSLIDLQRLRIVDCIEGCLTCRAQGSHRALQIASVYISYINQLCNELTVVDLERVRTIMKELSWAT